MAIDLKLTKADRESIAKFTKPNPVGKSMYPKEKIEKAGVRDLYISR